MENALGDTTSWCNTVEFVSAVACDPCTVSATELVMHDHRDNAPLHERVMRVHMTGFRGDPIRSDTFGPTLQRHCIKLKLPNSSEFVLRFAARGQLLYAQVCARD